MSATSPSARSRCSIRSASEGHTRLNRSVSCSSWTGDPDRLELLGGALIVKEAQSSAHATAIELVARALRRVFGDGWDVRVQLPVALDAESEPEPDVSVVPGDPRDYRYAHPERPVLVVEVSLSRVPFDRGYRGSLYAPRTTPWTCSRKCATTSTPAPAWCGSRSQDRDHPSGGRLWPSAPRGRLPRRVNHPEPHTADRSRQGRGSSETVRHARRGTPSPPSR